MGRCLTRASSMVSVAPGHRLQTEEHTVSNILSDPLFVRAEVDYRLERFGPRTPGVPSRPGPSRWLRRWAAGRRRAWRHHTGRPALVPSRPRHP